MINKKSKGSIFLIGLVFVFISLIIGLPNHLLAQTYPTYTTSKSTMNLSGTASDNINVARVSWTNNRGGGGNAVGTTNWSITGIPLQSGTNTIIVTVLDTTGNTTTGGMIVIYAPLTVTPNIAPTSTSVPSASGGGGGGGSQSAPILIPIFTATTTITILPTLLGPFAIGMKNDQVKILEQYLARDPAIYPEGTIDGYYNSAVVKAVQRFQTKYSVTSPSDSSYGLAGPATRAKIIQVLGNKGVSSATSNLTAREQLITQIKQLIAVLIAQLQAMIKASVGR